MSTIENITAIQEVLSKMGNDKDLLVRPYENNAQDTDDKDFFVIPDVFSLFPNMESYLELLRELSKIKELDMCDLIIEQIIEDLKRETERLELKGNAPSITI